jgi:hypothetical protein
MRKKDAKDAKAENLRGLDLPEITVSSAVSGMHLTRACKDEYVEHCMQEYPFVSQHPFIP